MRRTYLTLIFACLLSVSFAQDKINWPFLADVQYSYIQNYDANVWYGTPSFGEAIQALDGKEVIIKGYVLPLDVDGNQYVLSANPFNTCFFCGGAGQESVMELRLDKKRRKYETDQVVTFIGTLRLNDAELELNYILENARPYEG
ncbi:MAG: DUF3299 domain-containing protein [Bacteroidia bacterium]